MLNLISRLILPFCLLFTFSACQKEEIKIPFLPKEDGAQHYLHLSHTLISNTELVDPTVEQLDYSQFELLLLGGDMAFNSSINTRTMDYLDGVFDLSNSNTMWTLGNHDYSDPNLISQYTGRPTWYTYTKNDICFLILDTQYNNCNILWSQKNLVTQITDTIQDCSHLVILHHKMIQFYNHAVLEPLQWSVSNADVGPALFQINPNNFNDEIYPLLVNAQQRGVQVVCIGGDLGKKVNTFEHLTPDGIQYLASGIATNSDDNKGLLLKHHLGRRELTWETIPLANLRQK